MAATAGDPAIDARLRQGMTAAGAPGAAVDALLALVTGVIEVPGCPESPRPEFVEHLPAFVSAVAKFARVVT